MLNPSDQIAFEDKCFAAWMAKVDSIIASRLCGLDSNDLPDYCYRDAYDDGATPKGAASRAIRAAKEDF